ncbi:MAG: hypothetical protein F9K22_09520 [Bacteroidetes bacterium]|nr:MAG: hypothetical protein F9K22_09520 [Bacteroidota bacterium]
MKTLILMTALAAVPTAAQVSEQDVRARLDLISVGRDAEVRTQVQELLRTSPNDPGVLYLDAALTANGDQAVRKYQAVVDRFPKDVWADDALFRVYQYYYAVGLYKTAEAKMAQLNAQYPSSVYATKPVNVAERIPVTAPPATSARTEPEPAPAPAVSAPEVRTAGTGFAVQVGVYSQEATAQRQAKELTQTVGRPATVFMKISGAKAVYAVAFEGFTAETAARTFGAELKSRHNLDWFLVKR